MRRTLLVLAMLVTLMLPSEGALAGSGGAVLGPPTNFVAPSLEAICTYLGMAPLGMPPTPATCPNLDETTTALSPQIAEIAALSNSHPGSVRASFLWTNDFDFNPSPPWKIFPPDNTVSAVNPPVLDPFALFFEHNTLSQLTPIAFRTEFPNAVPSHATLLDDDPAPNSFFYAVTTGEKREREDIGERGERVQPEKLVLFFDYLPQNQPTFSKNQDIGQITLPLTVLDKGGSERSVQTILKIGAACAGDLAQNTRCLTATVDGDLGQHSAAEVGLTFRAHFGPSPNSLIPHAIYEVRAPLLVRGENDPAYFGVKIQVGGLPKSAQVGSPTGINQISGVPTAFHHDVLGFMPAFLGASVGIAPGAANYVAMFSNDGDGGSHLAVNTYLAISTSGATVGHVLRFCADVSFPGGRTKFGCGDAPQ